MSQLNVDNIRNRTGSNGGPNFPSGITVAVGQTAYIHGNLQVDGTETIVNTETLNVADKTVGIGSTSNASNTTADGSGIEVFASHTQTGNNKTLTWGNASNSWEFGPNDVGLKIGTGVTANSSGVTVTGVVTATSFKGDGSQLTGIDATAIQTGNTSVQTVDTGSDGHVKMTTEGGERVRVGPAGQIGLGGANYGTSGQVITSAGTGSAPSWAAIPPGGNQVDLVADGAIAAGKPVIITAAGKATQVGETLQGVNSYPGHVGAAELTPSGTRQDFDLSFDTYRNRVLWSYFDSTTVKVDVIEYAESYDDNTAQVRKTKSVYGGASTQANTSMAWDPDTNQTIIGYRDSSRLRISYASIDSGNEVTLGTAHAVTDNTVAPETIRIIYDTLNNAVICVWHAGAGNGIYARAGTISGDTMTWGSIAQLSGVTTGQGAMDACWDSTNNKVLVAFKNGQNNWYLSGAALSCSGTTLTWGSVVTLAGYSADFIKLAFDSDEGKALVTFKNTSNNNGYAKTFYIDSGTTVTSGVDVMFPGGTNGGTTWSHNALKGHSTVYDPRAKRFNITGCWTGSSLDQPFGNLIAINSGLDTLSWKGATEFYDNGFDTYDAWDRWASVSLSNWGKTVSVASRTNGTSRLWQAKNCTSTTNLYTGHTNVVGFAEDAISDGATGTIKTYGNIVGNQSGLTAGNTYYVGNDGSLAAGGGLAFYGGLALSATTLLIQRKMN